MTDKQIIIDDVDISKCEYRSKLLEGVCAFYRRCTNTFCPYKANWLKEQLKRKEQECEELKNFHINLVGVKECEIKELLKLKQTLIGIKKIACDGYNNGQTSYATLQCEKIINIINEVQNVENN